MNRSGPRSPGYSQRSYAARAARRRRRGTAAVAVILAAGVIAFAVGFLVFWALGSGIAGGHGFALRWPWSKPHITSQEIVERYSQLDFLKLPRSVDLTTFRDLSYVPVKGIYVTSWTAGIDGYISPLIALCDRTELNAMVIDVKDATGYIAYQPDVAVVQEMQLWEKRIPDVEGLLGRLREHNIFPIARIVCFNDPLLAEKKLDLAVQHKDGGVWKDRYGSSYTNPYSHEVWEYLVQVAEDAVRRGFREIQFDYVRFPTDGILANAVYPDERGLPEDAIAEFLQFARDRLHPLGAWVSADVFGHALDQKGDAGIGQRLEKVCRSVDIVCPMIYPSHYESGSYGIDNPDTNPYDTVTYATRDATRRFEGNGALYRPWLQDFAYPTNYGVTEVKAQIEAVEKQGYTEWILWDPNLRYTEGALRRQ
ncbi:MAG: putative glycoside hydrolase [Actinobacteria bacterium]|nr:putative glycoside hydrolase [Actinomycetota bacterium]